MKRLEDILKTVDYKTESDLKDKEVSGIALDSRKVRDNYLFIAYAGEKMNGHDFIGQAVQNGAKYVLLEDASFIKDDDTAYVLVEDLRKKVGYIASLFLVLSPEFCCFSVPVLPRARSFVDTIHSSRIPGNAVFANPQKYRLHVPAN